MEASAERRMVEQELTAAKEYAEKIIETVHEPLVVLTPDLTIESVNEAFYADFRVSREHTCGQKIYDLGNGQWNIPGLRKLLEEVLPNNNVFNDYEVRHHFENIGQRMMLFNARRLDHVQLILLGIRDITEQKISEEALRRSHAEMEIQVRERTAELERKNRELQEFAYVASHDLTEPLRKIQTFGDLLKAKGSDHLSEMEMDYISRMSGAANRMQELLEALLRYSRIESKGQDSGPTRLNDVVKDAVADLEVPIQNTKARVEIGHLPQVNGDPQQLRQLFQNLVANALKYHRPGVNTLVRIYAKRNDGTARIFVEDNGIGFDEKYLDKIFQPFQRLHGKNEYPGTGIGLAICKKIVERHGGTITARSTPGKGSTFIITLPADGTKTTNKPE